MHKKRLEKIVEKLETVPKREFNMSRWYQTNCNTVGCAIGHACQIPSFKRAGFKLHVYSNNTLTNETQWAPSYYYKEEDYTFGGWDGIERFLQINYDEALYLFCEESYDKPTKTNIIKRLRKFIKEGGMPCTAND